MCVCVWGGGGGGGGGGGRVISLWIERNTAFLRAFFFFF